MTFYVDPKDALDGEVRRMRRDLAAAHPGTPLPSPDAPTGVTAADAAEWAGQPVPLCPECDQPLTVNGLLTDAEAEAGGHEPWHVFCDLCGGAEHPAEMTYDWNGDTGNHLSCESEARNA